MMKWLAMLFVVLVACSAPTPVEDVKEEVVEPEVVVESSEVPEPAPEPTPAPEAETVEVEAEEVSDQVHKSDIHYYDFEPYSDLGCQSLVTVSEFAETCDLDEQFVEVTHRLGTRNCYVTMVDKRNSRLTAGVSLGGYDKLEEAQAEFDRRMDIFQKENDGSVGEKSYTAIKVNRHEVEFIRGPFLVSVGSDVTLCTPEKILALAKVVDGKLSSE